MGSVKSPNPQIPPEVIHHFGIASLKKFESAQNDNWLVDWRGTHLVLRRYKHNPLDVIPYENEVMRRLQDLGWPVPGLVEGPLIIDGRPWSLLTFLPGASRPDANTPGERRDRGRLLAELHESMESLADLGQRTGFSLSNELVADPELVLAFREYKEICPDEGHVLRWHLDRTLELFEGIDLDDAETLVLHSDFAPWNLLYEGDKLKGILDFDATHLNYRVADFVNSWRGYQDELIEGYEEVHKLTDVDWELLVPVYWSLMFLGAKDNINAMLSGEIESADFGWAITHLLRREGLLAERADEYPGRTGQKVR
jgi:Ser/Thr protein kinase RdoA (MazF antagonist)